MARKIAKEMTVEEFEDWSNASKKFEEVAEAADEVGGPRLSLVPLPGQNAAWPTDLLPPTDALPLDGGGLGGGDGGAAPEACAYEPPIEATPFDGIPLESSP